MTLLLKETPEQLILRIADSLEPAIRATFLNGVEAIRRKVPVNVLTELLEEGKITAALDALAEVKLTPEELAPIQQAIQDAVIRVAKPTAAEFGLAFDLVQPRAIRWATEQAGKMIVQIDSETRMAVADIVSTGLREGVAPRQQALLIREIVGLTRRDAGAVDRFLSGAVDSGMNRVQARDQAERMARRLLNRRAENIARTETIRASNMGTQLAWESAQDAGLLPPGTQKVWIATEDQRLCPICAVLDGQVIDLGGSFDVQEEATAWTIDGQEIRVTATRPLKKPSTTKTPPAHPSCRCTEGIESVEPITQRISTGETETWKRDLNVEGWMNGQERAPWDMTEAEFKAHPPPGFKVESSPRTHWARNADDAIYINDRSGFFATSPEHRQFTILHETGHDVERFLTGTQERFDRLLDVWDDPTGPFRSDVSGMVFEGHSRVVEAVSDAYAVLWDQELVSRTKKAGFGRLLDLVSVEAKAAGLPIPTITKISKARRSQQGWTCGGRDGSKLPSGGHLRFP